MSNAIKPIRVATHRERAWKPSAGYGFASNSNITQIASEELAHMATQYALGFIDDETPSMVALLGLAPQQNLYVAPDGHWLGEYVPAVLRGYPFKLIPAENGQFALGYDEGSGLLAASGEAEPFFDDNDLPTERISQILQFMVSLQKGIDAIGRASLRLKEHGLLEPWPIKIRDGETEIPINGLLRINEAHLTNMDDAAFTELRKGGVLALAYAQLLSMTNISKLGRLAHAHAQHNAMSEKQQQEIKSMFVPTHIEDEIDWDAMLKDD
jgi:hypothetical protein